MGDPSSSPSVAEPLESDRFSPLMELIQLYHVEQAMLLAHQREVERRRAAVRTAAEREASEILLAARREIRRVLVRTRHELATLTAQVRAAGCEPAQEQSRQSIVGDDFQLSAARDVRDVLRDARSELDDLSKEAVTSWPTGEEPRLLPPAAAMAPLPEPAAAIAPLPNPTAVDEVSSAPIHDESGGDADASREQLPASGPSAQFVVRWRTAEISATDAAERLFTHWRIAVIVLAVLAIVAMAIAALRPSSRTEAGVTPSQPPSAESTTQETATQQPSAQAPTTGSNAAAAIGTSTKPVSDTLSLTLEVRRPVWLRINADGGADSGRMYEQGERRTIQASREILVRAGDAGAVLVSLGGGAPTPLGPDGQVRTRRFANQRAATTDPAGEGPTPTQTSDPLAQAVASAGAAGAERDAPPSATVGNPTTVPTFAPGEPDAPVAESAYAAAAEREILERHQRWFDAFTRGDRETMASLAADNFSLLDQRPERAPVAGRVERTISDLRVQVTAGIGAVVSGRITEMTIADEPLPAVSVAMFSEVWIRQGEEWQLVSVRLVPLNAVPTTLQ